MNLEEVQEKIRAIKNKSGDDEVQHSLEDELYREILRWVSKTAPVPFCDVAKKALSVRRMKFARWCA